jgi:predicted metal-binding protein
MSVFEIIREQIAHTDVFQYGAVKTSEIVYLQEIRDICKDNSCGQYGKTWACPPAVGSLEECRERCSQYDTILVFTGIFPLDNSFGFNSIVQGVLDFKKIAHTLDRLVKPHVDDYLMLSNEGCGTCQDCTYPDAPCRFPDQLHHSVEGYGILVNELANKTKVAYNNGENIMTFFGALLFNDV